MLMLLMLSPDISRWIRFRRRHFRCLPLPLAIAADALMPLSLLLIFFTVALFRFTLSLSFSRRCSQLHDIFIAPRDAFAFCRHADTPPQIISPPYFAVIAA